LVNTQLSFISKTALNGAPYINEVIDDRTAQFGAPPIEISIANLFSDPENDPITYSVSSSNAQVTSVALEGTMLRMFLFKVGSSDITITASDGLDTYASTDFKVSVNELITNVDPEFWENHIRAFPNPFNNQFSIQYTAVQPSFVKIQIFDSNGKLVWISERYAEVEGENRIAVVTDQLNSGIYHCRLSRANGETATVRVLKK
ncbi:MAG TPA: T9SS type A sorting domain-containing protein, partial [Cyclobacteriaceae bacterium]|nr:T9SS type A sorting domain-containing protein [Cyclobacteriaceae bacterium]